MPYIPTPIDPQEPILEITPGDFKITLTANKDHVVELKLKNLTTHSVAYKVKTTAPDKYQVRPIQSSIKPAETATCMIVLKAMSTLPDPTDTKALRHKFLIQSVFYDDETEIGALWKSVEIAHKTMDGRPTYHDQRITCTLVVPDPTAPVAIAGSPSIDTGASSAAMQRLEHDLNEKKKEFDGLMEFSLKQNTQIKTLSAQLQTKEKEVDTLRRSVVELEKVTNAQQQQNAALKPVNATVAETPAGLPVWALPLALIIGIIIARILFCPSCN